MAIGILYRFGWQFLGETMQHALFVLWNTVVTLFGFAIKVMGIVHRSNILDFRFSRKYNFNTVGLLAP